MTFRISLRWPIYIVNSVDKTKLSCVKTSLVRNHAYGNVFRFQVHFHANQSHFHKNGFCMRTRFEKEAQGNTEMAWVGLFKA